MFLILFFFAQAALADTAGSADFHQWADKALAGPKARVRPGGRYVNYLIQTGDGKPCVVTVDRDAAGHYELTLGKGREIERLFEPVPYNAADNIFFHHVFTSPNQIQMGNGTIHALRLEPYLLDEEAEIEIQLDENSIPVTASASEIGEPIDCQFHDKPTS